MSTRTSIFYFNYYYPLHPIHFNNTQLVDLCRLSLLHLLSTAKGIDAICVSVRVELLKGGGTVAVSACRERDTIRHNSL